MEPATPAPTMRTFSWGIATVCLSAVLEVVFLYVKGF